MHKNHTHFRANLDAESRLLHLVTPSSEASNSHETTVENAEKGIIDHTGKPLDALESNTRKLDSKIKEISTTMVDSLPGRVVTGFLSTLFKPAQYTANFLEKFPVLGYAVEKARNVTTAVTGAVGLQSATYEQKVRALVDAEAKRRLEDGGAKLETARRWILRHRDRAENKLFLRRARVEVLKDLQNLVSLEQQEVGKQANKSREIAKLLGDSNSPITKNMAQSQEYFRKVLGHLMQEANDELKDSGTINKQLDAAQKAQIWMSSELFEAGATPEQIEDAFKALRSDRTILETLIREKIPADKRGNFLHWAKTISKLSGFEFLGGFQSQKEDDRPPLSRVGELFSNPPVGKPVLFSVNGQEFRASLMPTTRIRGEMLFKINGSEGRGAFVVVSQKGDVSMRIGGKLVTQTFSEKAKGGNTFFRHRSTLN